MSRMHFGMNPQSIFAWISRISLLETVALSEVCVTATGLEGAKTYVINKRSTIWSNWPKNWAELWVILSIVHLTVCYYHVTYSFQSETTCYICLNINEPFSRNRSDLWNLSYFNGTRTHNHLLHKRTFKHLAKPTKWLSWIVSTYPYRALDCMSLSCHVSISEWIHTLYFS